MDICKKNLSTIMLVLSWFLVGLIICLVGLMNTYALEKPNVVYYYDNNGSSLTYLGHGVDLYQGEFLSMPSSINFPGSNSSTNYGGAIAIPLDSPLISGSNYSITIYGIVYDESGTQRYSSILSSKSNLGIGTNLQNAVNSYINNTNATENYVSSESNILYYNFTSTTNGNILLIPFSSSSNVRGVYAFGGYQLTSNGNNLSQTQIQNITTQQTNDLKNSISNSTNTITGAISDTENNLNNSINEMGENIQQGIKDGFEQCRDSYNLFNLDLGSYGSIGLNYSIKENTGFSFRGWAFNFINNTGVKSLFKPNTTYTLSFDVSITDLKDYNTTPQKIIALYKNGSFIPLTNLSILDILDNKVHKSTYTFTTPANLDSYSILLYSSLNSSDNVRSTMKISNLMLVEGSTAKLYENYGEKFCKNRIDETNDKIDETNNQLGNLNSNLTDDTPISLDSLNNTAGWLPPGPIDSILNLPLTMLNNISLALSKTCSPLHINIPYINRFIDIPCLSTIFNQITGVNSFWTWVGTIASVIILYQYLIGLYAWVDKVLELRVEFDTAMGVDMANWGRL